MLAIVVVIIITIITIIFIITIIILPMVPSRMPGICSVNIYRMNTLFVSSFL